MTEPHPPPRDPHLAEVAQWHPIEGTPMKKKVAIGCSIGATIETYDFIGFGIAAALYFNNVFFPATDPLSGTLLSFATLGIGFAVRPLGGIIGGYLGDRIGRKPVLVGSLLLMGIATVLIGVLPTYQQVGVWAGILLVAVRVVQGLAFGAEWGGAILMCFEHAPWRKKGLYTGITQAGFPVGLLLANFAFLVSVPLGDQWAWRVPFLLSAVLIVVGILIRLKIEESPEFEELKEEGELSKNPLLEVLRDDWRNMLRAFCLRIAETAGYAVSVTFILSYLSSQKLADRPTTLTALMIAAALGIFATILWGALTDRIGRRPVYLLGTALTVVWGVPLFLVVNTGTAIAIIIAFVVSYTICQNSLAGVQGAWFSELFAAKTRTTGASLAYQLSAVVSGFTPLVATALFAGVGWIGPALLFSAYGLLGLIAALVTRETWGRAEREEVAALERTLALPAARSRLRTRKTHEHPHRPDLQAAAYRIRLNALHMGEVQGQGYIGQALGVADVLAVVYTDQLRHRPEDPHWADRDRFLLSIGHYAIALYAALAEAGTIPVEELSDLRLRRVPAADVRHGVLHARHGDLRRLARPRPRRRHRDGAGAAPPGQPGPRLQPALRRRARRGLDLGGRAAGRPPRPGQPHRDRRRQRAAGRRAHRRACCAPSRSPTSGARSAGTPCASTATTSPRSSTRSTSCASTAARPGC